MNNQKRIGKKKLEKLLNGELLKEDDNIPIIEDYIQRNQYNINPSSLFKISRVVFFGENHNMVSPKKDFTLNIPNLVKAGVTHLALEIPSSIQEDLDKFYNKRNKTNLLSYLYDKTILNDDAINKYIKMIEIAKRNNLRLTALDIKSDFQKKSSTNSHYINHRNKQWSDIMSNILESDENSKIAVYCGSAHYGYDALNQRANNYLEKKGYNTWGITYCGGKKYNKNIGDSISSPFFDEKINETAVKLGLKNKKFTVLINRNILRDADLYIHLPQIEDHN